MIIKSALLIAASFFTYVLYILVPYLGALLDIEPSVPIEQRTHPPYREYLPAQYSSCGALVVHGLNLRPDKMSAISEYFQSQGCYVIQLALTLHQHPNENLNTLGEHTWPDEIHAAVTLLKQGAPDATKYFGVGYSLGGLLITKEQNQFNSFDRLLLLAPALGIDYDHLLLRFSRALQNLQIPTGVPMDLRVRDNANLVGSVKTLELLKNLQDSAQLDALNIPSLIIINPQDPIVSHNKIKQFVETNKLSQWSFYLTNTIHHKRKKELPHSIFDSTSVGDTEWTNILNAIYSKLF